MVAIAFPVHADAPDASSLAIAVAPFERHAPPGAELPDIAQLLADRFATQGVKKIVGPAELAVDPADEPDAEPDAATVMAWSARAGVTAMVVGRVTRIGQPISIDLRLRSAQSGEVLETFVAEVLKPTDVDSVIDDLTRQVIAAAVGAAPAAPGAVSAAPSGGSDRESFGIRFDSDRPISIRADELESVRTAGTRKLLFTNNVVVVQDDVTIRSSRLEAFYPKDSSQPDRMIATGRVRMTNAKNEARCDRAIYDRAEGRLICRGNAELREGNDCVAGEWIEFDLESETVKVGGGAKVVIGGKGANSSGGCR
jgi:lipopolysaccharide transport protein LptA